MTLKGKVFTSADAPRSIRRNPAKCQEWCAEQTARYKVVAVDPLAPPGKREFIAEEISARALARLSSKARRVAGAMLRMSPEVRVEILAAFKPDGSLVIPFVKVE